MDAQSRVRLRGGGTEERWNDTHERRERRGFDGKSKQGFLGIFWRSRFANHEVLPFTLKVHFWHLQSVLYDTHESTGCLSHTFEDEKMETLEGKVQHA